MGINETMAAVLAGVSKVRLALGIPGTGVSVLVAPHKNDPTKLVLKTPTLDGGPVLCRLMGIEAGKTWRGENNWITEVNAQVFAGSLVGLVATLMDAARALDARAAEGASSTPEPEGEGEGETEEGEADESESIFGPQI